MTLCKFTVLVKLILLFLGGGSVVIMQLVTEAALMSSIVKLLEQLEKVLPAI